MKKVITALFSMAMLFGLIIIQISSTEAAAVSYIGHDGSVDKYMTKKIIKQYDRPNQWLYYVEICATDKHLKISTVTLKSNIDEAFFSGFKTLRQGDCTPVGSVMKANDINTLGGTMMEKHEAVQRMQELIEGDNKNMSKAERSELSRLQSITGVYLR